MMQKTEKILGMLTLLKLNDDQFCYEMTSLASKINNFLDDRSRLLSGQWLSVIYKSLTEENDSETVEIRTYPLIEKDTTGTMVSDYTETNAKDTLDIDSPRFNDSRFALV